MKYIINLQNKTNDEREQIKKVIEAFGVTCRPIKKKVTTRKNIEKAVQSHPIYDTRFKDLPLEDVMKVVSASGNWTKGTDKLIESVLYTYEVQRTDEGRFGIKLLMTESEYLERNTVDTDDYVIIMTHPKGGKVNLVYAKEGTEVSLHMPSIKRLDIDYDMNGHSTVEYQKELKRNGLDFA